MKQAIEYARLEVAAKAKEAGKYTFASAVLRGFADEHMDVQAAEKRWQDVINEYEKDKQK